MKFSGKVFFKIILKVTKNQDFSHSLEDAFFKNREGGQFDTPSYFKVTSLCFHTVKQANLLSILFHSSHIYVPKFL